MSESEKLLTVKEQDACQRIAVSSEGLAGQRAAALLAIDQGAMRAQASEQTGLTVGQVGYLLRVFRQKRLGLFPDAEPVEAQPTPAAAASEPEEDKEAKKAKGKKPKKGKGKTKAKKKEKKQKKGKKSKAKKDKAAKKKSKKK